MQRRRYVKREVLRRWGGWTWFFESILYVLFGLFQKFMDMSPEMADYRYVWAEDEPPSSFG
jgi:hypothetical protein